MASPATIARPEPLKIERHVWVISGVVIVGMIMSILDTTIVNVALDTLSRDLHSPISQVQWVVTGYLLALAAVIPITGWAARRYGAKRVYLTSLVLFTAGSAACGLSGSIGSAGLAVVLERASRHGHGHAALAGAFDSAYWWALGIALLSLLPCLMLLRAERPVAIEREFAASEAAEPLGI
jgi:MFS family permease